MRHKVIVAALLSLFVPTAASAQVVVQTAPPPPPVVVTQPVYTQPVYAQPAPAQPVYVQPTYAQPVYGQPMYAQPMYAQRVRPRRSGGGGLIGAGAGVLGAFWLVTVFTGLVQASIAGDSTSTCWGTGGCSGLFTEGMVNLIPVAGPFINAVTVGSSHNTWSGSVAVLYTFDGLVQTAGLIMLITGAVIRSRSNLASTDHSRWAVLPSVTPQSAGLSLSYVTF